VVEQHLVDKEDLVAVARDSDGRTYEVRWSRQRKARVVLRILGGEPIDRVAQTTGVAVSTLAEWHDRFVRGGTANLRGTTSGSVAPPVAGRRCPAEHSAAGEKGQLW
jgi:transposase-like protein